MLHRLTQEEVISGINTIRSFLRELGDELLNFSRDEIEVNFITPATLDRDRLA